MKNIGKPFTIIFLIVTFLLGLGILVFDYARFEAYIKLVEKIGVPVLVIMGGIAGQSIAKVIKGESKISEVEDKITEIKGFNTDDGK